jgi:hypothetical protein
MLRRRKPNGWQRGTILNCFVSGLAVACGLPTATASEQRGSPSPPTPPPPAGPVQYPDPYRLKPHQEITSGPPPLSPSQFDPDPNKVRLPTNSPPAPGPKFERIVTFSSNAPPLAPSVFNPDPGAMLRPPVAPPSEPRLFTDEVSAPALFSPPVIAPEQALPRLNLRREEIVPLPPPVPGNYGYEPLPPGQALPREKTRRNLPIETHFEVPEYSVLPDRQPPHSEPRPDRYRVGFAPWRRYTSGDIEEQPFLRPDPYLWHPYHQSILKGDVPIIGQDIFLNLTASTQTELEFRRVPTPSNISASRPGQSEFFGDSEQILLQNYLAFSALLFKGETAFKPVEWEVKLMPVYNINYVNVKETGAVSPDPRGSLGGRNGPALNSGGITNPGDVGGVIGVPGGVTPAPGSTRGTQSTVRTRDYFALQEWTVELHLRDLSDNYDFIAARAGNQPFSSDFRGFIFNDINLGARLFGNYRNNHWQYNLAFFEMREKDTNSDLNSFESRGQQVLIANWYWQDFIWKGYTAQWSFHANWDDASTHYDRNGFIVRPAPIGTVTSHDVQAYYLGWAGDGHIGRFNVSHAFYQVFGHDDFNGLAGRPVDINAQMAALELSYDRDWMRYKFSFFYASGDGDTEDGTARGFDTILDNPNFTGGPFSWYVRQGFNLAGTSVGLKQRGSLVPNLRTSKTQGQANFVNPGLFLFGLGLDIDVTPKVKAFLNANYLRFAETDPIKTALLTNKVDPEFGYDLSLGVQWRPLLTDNIIISCGFGAFLPGQGFRDIYKRNPDPVPSFDPRSQAGEADGFLYSALLAINFIY